MDHLRVSIVDAGGAGGNLLADILDLQSQLAWRPDLTASEQARGFLATTWSLAELRALLDEGAYAAVAADSATGQLQGYSLMAPIRHLPPGDFVPAPGSPIRARADLMDGRRFVYGYQLAVRRGGAQGGLPASVAILRAIAGENTRRGINAVSCVMEAPACNALSQGFLSAMGLTRIGTLHASQAPPLIRGQVTWACMLRLPLRFPRAIQGGGHDLG
jgi:hypothetical protein